MLEGAKGEIGMKTMAKAGMFVLGVAIPLLVLTTSPVSAATVEYQMWVEDDTGTQITNLTALAAGTYTLKVQARVLDNKIADRWKSGLSWYDVYGGMTQFTFSLQETNPTQTMGWIGDLPNEGIYENDSSQLKFAHYYNEDDGAFSYPQTWGTTMGAALGTYFPAVGVQGHPGGQLNKTLLIVGDNFGKKYDVLDEGAAISASAGSANGKAGGIRIKINGADAITGEGGTPSSTPPDDADRWFDLVSGQFDYAGGFTTLTMTTGATAVSTYTLSSNKWSSVAPASVTVNTPTLVFGTDGSGGGEAQDLYGSQANLGLAANAPHVANPASWNHTARGGWWNTDPTAFITLDGTFAQTADNKIQTWAWTITDATAAPGDPASLTIYSQTPITNVTIQQLIEAGFATPPRLEDNGGAITYGTLALSVYEGVGADGSAVADFNYGNSSGGTLFALPEPASMVVLGLGAVATLLRRRRRA